MKVLVWVAPGTWPAVIEAARVRPETDELTVIAADDPEQAVPGGALLGLMGRGRPSVPQSGLSRDEAEALVRQASEALGRPCRQLVASGPTERVITAAADEADLLILARDGDRSRLGPHSLGRHARFIIDHAPCTVELIWPDGVPGLGTIPPPPH